MAETFADIAASGPMLLAIAVAAIAGLVSFLSPCVLPLVPGYVSYISGLASSDLPVKRAGGSAGAVLTVARPASYRRVLAGTLGFVTGFSAVFITAVVALSAATRFLLVNARTIEVVVGTLIVVLGLGYLGVFPILQRQARITWLPTAGIAGAPVLGATFALSWTPCATPTLGAVLGMATREGTAGRAAVLAVAYCVGLGVPFVGVGLGLRRLLSFTSFVRRHNRWVTWIGAGMLITVGTALVTGLWNDVVIWLLTTAGPSPIGL